MFRDDLGFINFKGRISHELNEMNSFTDISTLEDELSLSPNLGHQSRSAT